MKRTNLIAALLLSALLYGPQAFANIPITPPTPTTCTCTCQAYGIKGPSYTYEMFGPNPTCESEDEGRCVVATYPSPIPNFPPGQLMGGWICTEN